MAQKDKNAHRNARMEELVEYTAPYARDERDRPIYAAVGSETLRVARGETVMIKRKFLEVLNNAAAQERLANITMRQLQEAGKKPLASI